MIEHNGWTCVEGTERDGDGFNTPEYTAQRGDETRTINHSRFGFTMTPARFAWLVDNDFPPSPGIGPWTEAQLDERIAA